MDIIRSDHKEIFRNTNANMKSIQFLFMQFFSQEKDYIFLLNI
jgi:hypothetical protein